MADATEPPCWRCKKNHAQPRAIYICRRCHQALCADDVRVRGTPQLAHSLSPDVLCGPVKYLGQWHE